MLRNPATERLLKKQTDASHRGTHTNLIPRNESTGSEFPRVVTFQFKIWKAELTRVMCCKNFPSWSQPLGFMVKGTTLRVEVAPA